MYIALAQYRISSSCVPSCVILIPSSDYPYVLFRRLFVRFFVKVGILCSCTVRAVSLVFLFVAVREIARCIISFAMAINTSFVQLCCYVRGEDKVLGHVLQTTMVSR